jgi:hypothetical protein
MTEAEKWAEYDRTEHALGILISHFSACIYAEKKGEEPDQEQIEEWRNKRSELMQLRRTLTVEDMATIGLVNKTYVPKAQAVIRQTRHAVEQGKGVIP